MRGALEWFVQAPSVSVVRASPKGRKAVELKEYVGELSASPRDADIMLAFTLRYGPSGSARVDEVVTALAGRLGIEPLVLDLTRRGVTWKGLPSRPEAATSSKRPAAMPRAKGDDGSDRRTQALYGSAGGRLTDEPRIDQTEQPAGEGDQPAGATANEGDQPAANEGDQPSGATGDEARPTQPGAWAAQHARRTRAQRPGRRSKRSAAPAATDVAAQPVADDDREVIVAPAAPEDALLERCPPRRPTRPWPRPCRTKR